MDTTNEASTIVNAIMDMDLNDKIAVKNVMDKIVNHASVVTYLIGDLLATKHHRHAKLLKWTFVYYQSWTPHSLWGFVFGIDKGPHFLVNVFEPQPRPTHGIRFELDGKTIKEEDVPVPPLQYVEIEKFVRIDVFGSRTYRIKNVAMPKTNSTADGRFYSMKNVDIDEMIVSLHRRKEGFKLIDELTNYHDDEPYVSPNDTIENKILNIIYESYTYIKHPGDLSTLAKCLLTGVKVHQPYQESGDHILAVESPIDKTLFMLIFGRTVEKTINEQKIISKGNMRKLLAHYVPEYISNQRQTIFMAITYNVTLNYEIIAVDTISSLMHSSESSEVKRAVEVYKHKATLMHRCRQVIVKNMCTLGDQIRDLPITIQRFIYSSKSAIEVIDY